MDMSKQLDPNNKNISKNIIIRTPIKAENWKCGFVENNKTGDEIIIPNLTKEFKLKSSIINEGYLRWNNKIIFLEFLAFLRIALIFLYEEKDYEDILITIPCSMEYEMTVLNMAINLLSDINSKYLQKSFSK